MKIFKVSDDIFIDWYNFPRITNQIIPMFSFFYARFLKIHKNVQHSIYLKKKLMICISCFKHMLCFVKHILLSHEYTNMNYKNS